jgi:hypothetical protein
MNPTELLVFLVLTMVFSTVYLSKYRVYWSTDRSHVYHVSPEYASIAYRCMDDLGRTPIKLVLSTVKNTQVPWMRIE